MAAREAHGAKPKSNGNRNASVVSYDKASFESLDGSCRSDESHVISPHPHTRDLPPSRVHPVPVSGPVVGRPVRAVARG